MSTYVAYKILSFLSRVLPEKLAYWFGLRIADGFYYFNRRGRAAVQSNIKQILESRHAVPAEGALQGLARKNFQYFGKYLVDFFRYGQLTPEQMRQRITIEHPEYIEQAVALGRGVLCVSAHFGNWELGGAVMSALGYKVNAVEMPQELEKLNQMFQRRRQARGVTLIPLGRAVFEIVRCLRRGEVVGLLGDRDFTAQKDRIDFFGKPARLPRGPAWLSIKTGAPILVGFVLRQVDDSFVVRMYPPILPEKEGSEDAIRIKIRDLLETCVGEYPYQWFIFDDFWADAGTSAVGGKTT